VRHSRKRRGDWTSPGATCRPSRRWVLEGDPSTAAKRSWPRHWYGVDGFFRWLETKAYKMHIRVLLSRYRAYTECGACNGARLKPQSQWWHLHAGEGARAAGIVASIR
jgi:excinuclease UvrABC ATPase subunit